MAQAGRHTSALRHQLRSRRPADVRRRRDTAPEGAKYLRRAATTDGSAAEVAERGKRERYPVLPSAGLEAVVPFCIEPSGRLGPAALKLLHVTRQRAAERSEGFRGWAGVALQTRWLAQLSCCLVRSLHEAARAMRGEAGPLVAAAPADTRLLSALVSGA